MKRFAYVLFALVFNVFSTIYGYGKPPLYGVPSAFVSGALAVTLIWMYRDALAKKKL